MSIPASQRLRQTTGQLRARLEALQPDRRNPVSIKPDDLASLLADLGAASDCIHKAAPACAENEEWHQALSEYRQTLERLQRILPGIHDVLLKERARLEALRTHLAAAGAWANASKSTL